MEETEQKSIREENSIPVKNNKKVIKEVKEWALCAIIAYTLFLIINNLFFSMPQVRQTSMYPTIDSGERVLVNCNKVFSEQYNKGEIIVFTSPYTNIKKDTIDVKASYPSLSAIRNFTYYNMGIGKMSLVKRIIGTAGDHVEIAKDGYVHLNGVLLDETKYLADAYTPELGIYTDVIVPEGYVFVMGDNRDGSKDSRAFGCIPVSRIEGKVVSRIWPLTKFGKIEKAV